MASRVTYRVQLRTEFGFAATAGVAEYLAALGVTHLYCSPYFQAVTGSAHGYDVVDPRQLSRDLGGAPAHAEMTAALAANGLGQVLDIVPNHMATDAANEFWWDVLENGPASRYAAFFDIDWAGDASTGGAKAAFRVLAPILGDHYGRVLEAGELHLRRDGGSFEVRYYEHRLPVSPRTLDRLLTRAARRCGSAALAEVAAGFGSLPPARMADAAAVAERHEHKQTLAAGLATLAASQPDVAAAVDAEVAELNDDPDRFDTLLRRQNYRLAFWRTASEEVDYRRFFNIESLVALRAEDPDVFDTTHGLVLELVADGTVEGLRVDHVDGLRDPQGYLQRLAERTGGLPTVVEKILAAGEELPEAWQVAGTTGYDFLNRVNDTFVATGNEATMTRAYQEFTGECRSFDEVAVAAKHQVMAEDLAAEVERLTGLLAEVCDDDRRHRDHTRRELREALREVVARFPVYRTYWHPSRGASEQDRRYVGAAVDATLEGRPDLDAELVRFLGSLALGEPATDLAARFALRFQQLTAPVTAKGVEDTAFYRYHRLTSLNEVGGDPGTFGRSAAAFHAATAQAAARWPDAMLTLSTHDTKRGGDVRARLNVLSQIPQRWKAAVERWAERSARHRCGWNDPNTEYLLYQTLVGAWPIDADRLVAYMTKAVREAKVRTSWTTPDGEYEIGLERFVRALLADEAFVHDLERFLADEAVVALGRRSSLAQVALLLTCPGCPDLYQGTELWDLSLVDPDNRRPVDYALRRGLLGSLGHAPPGAALERDDVGASKLWLIHRLLQLRGRRPALFASTVYEPLRFTGPRGEDVLGFHRGDLAVVVPRFGGDAFDGTAVALPAGSWTDVLTGEAVGGGTADLAGLLRPMPVTVLARAGA